MYNVYIMCAKCINVYTMLNELNLLELVARMKICSQQISLQKMTIDNLHNYRVSHLR